MEETKQGFSRERWTFIVITTIIFVIGFAIVAGMAWVAIF